MTCTSNRRRINGVLSTICVGLSVLAVGCGTKNKNSNWNQKSDGVLIQASASEIQKEFPESKIITVSKAHNIYKLDAEIGDVREKLPNAHAEENVFFKAYKTQSDNFEKMSSVNEIIASLQCVKVTQKPKAIISHVSGGDFIVSNIVRAGTSEIQVTAKESLSAQPGVSTLDYHWIVIAPPASQNEPYINSPTYTVNPDMNGEYTLILVVKDSLNQGCALTVTTIGATTDIAYQGAQINWQIPHNFDMFFHLRAVQTESAWNTTLGQDTVVAVIDSGMNYNHPDLANKLFINPNEIANNGLDDDGNGFIDDVHGYDFAFGDNIPYDDESHGTHVSGLIAGSQSGIAPNAKVLPIKAIYPTGSATLSSVVSAILYATEMKVDIINMSLGGEGETSPLVKTALEEARNAGILVVVAAGNDGKNVDEIPFFMNEKDGQNVLAVGATDEYGNITDYSNFGVQNVGISAPGGTDKMPIMSTYSYNFENEYIGYPGTSMASPIVAGVAALVKSANRELTGVQIKQILKQTAVQLPALNTTIQSGRFVNASAAVQYAQMILPQ